MAPEPTPEHLAQRREHIQANVTVDPDTGCWIWQLYIAKSGYGWTRIRGLGPMGAHRASYIAHTGPIPKGLHVDHMCFNPPCVNPAHLRLLTASENASIRRSALADHCAAGHPRTQENLTWYEGKRRCRMCRKLRRRKPDGRIAQREAKAALS